MGRYVVRRLGQALLAVACVTALVFFVARLLGDPSTLMAPPEATVQQVLEIRQRMGLDRPLIVQFLEFARGALQGDLGQSYRQGRPALSVVMSTLPKTLELALTAQLLALIIGIPLGILAAARRKTWVDSVTTGAAVVGQSVPMFWLGLMLIVVFGVKLRLLPVSGTGGVSHLILPALTLATYSMARTARLVRSGMLDQMGQEYMLTARAKGLSEHRVLIGHGLRNALIPVVTIISLDFAVLLGGAVVTETVFAWPGLGRLVVNAINTRDFPVIQASVIVIAVVFVMINLIVDVLYTVIDPRVRLT